MLNIKLVKNNRHNISFSVIFQMFNKVLRFGNSRWWWWFVLLCGWIIKVRKSFYPRSFTAQKMKFSVKDFFSTFNQIRRKLRIWLHLLKKSLTDNFIFMQCLLEALISSNLYCANYCYSDNHCTIGPCGMYRAILGYYAVHKYT